MNAFRFLGDMSHLFSVLLLLLKIYSTKSCSGSSPSPFIRFTLVAFWPVGETRIMGDFCGVRDLAQDAGAVRAGVPHPLPGSLHLRCLGV